MPPKIPKATPFKIKEDTELSQFSEEFLKAQRYRLESDLVQGEGYLDESLLRILIKSIDRELEKRNKKILK